MPSDKKPTILGPDGAPINPSAPDPDFICMDILSRYVGFTSLMGMPANTALELMAGHSVNTLIQLVKEATKGQLKLATGPVRHLLRTIADVCRVYGLHIEFRVGYNEPELKTEQGEADGKSDVRELQKDSNQADSHSTKESGSAGPVLQQ